MNKQSKMIIGLTFGIALLFTSTTVWSAGLIAPTRSLSGSIDEKATLNVSSEPPGLDVTLDGTSIGKTPVIEKEIEPGSHMLRIRDSETEIFATKGKPIHLSWFKGAFIEIPLKKEDQQQPQAEVVREKPKPKPEAPQKRKGEFDPAYWPTNPKGPIAPYIR